MLCFYNTENISKTIIWSQNDVLIVRCGLFNLFDSISFLQLCPCSCSVIQSLLLLSTVYLGVGGIEAEAVMLGQSISMVLPQVVGYKIIGQLGQLTTSTDVVLTITKVRMCGM